MSIKEKNHEIVMKWSHPTFDDGNYYISTYFDKNYIDVGVGYTNYEVAKYSDESMVRTNKNDLMRYTDLVRSRLEKL